jgi:hypothetical protein
MLNKKAIFEVLNAAPLCDGNLIKQRGFNVEYCAMGALAKSVGATDEELYSFDTAGNDIWRYYGNAITAKFGIESLQQFQKLMHANDAERFATRRNKAVASVVEALSPEQINDIIRDESAEMVEVKKPIPVVEQQREILDRNNDEGYHYGSDD